MTKRRWFIVAGTIAVAACGHGRIECDTAGYNPGENRPRDPTNVVCFDTRPDQPTAPTPTVFP